MEWLVLRDWLKCCLVFLDSVGIEYCVRNHITPKSTILIPEGSCSIRLFTQEWEWNLPKNQIYLQIRSTSKLGSIPSSSQACPTLVPIVVTCCYLLVLVVIVTRQSFVAVGSWCSQYRCPLFATAASLLLAICWCYCMHLHGGEWNGL